MDSKIFFRMVWMVVLLPSLAAGGRPGAGFLSMGVGAEAAGLNSAVTALSADPAALHWNPGGLAFVSGREILISRQTGANDLSQDFIGYVHPMARSSWGVSTLRLSHGGLETRDANGRLGGTFSADDGAAALGVGRRLTAGTGAGVGVKFIRQTIGTDFARGLAVDAGWQARSPSGRFRGGVAVRHLGPSLRFRSESVPLPSIFSAGGAVSFLGFTRFSGDFLKPLNGGKAAFGAGVELSPHAAVVFRAGYSAPLMTSSAPTGLSGFGWGMGLTRNRYVLDYAFVPGGDLGDAHHVTVKVKF